MSFSEWTRKKKQQEEKQGASSTSRAVPVTTTKTEASGSNSSEPMSFSNWTAERKKQKATVSVQDWAESASDLLDEVGSYYNRYRNDEDEYTSYQDRVSHLLASADNFRKQ